MRGEVDILEVLSAQKPVCKLALPTMRKGWVCTREQKKNRVTCYLYATTFLIVCVNETFPDIIEIAPNEFGRI